MAKEERKLLLYSRLFSLGGNFPKFPKYKYYAFNIMYIKLHELRIMDKKPNKIHENLIPKKLANIPYIHNK